MTKEEYNVIGEGSFGCAIKPSLHCSNKNITYKNKISKIMTSKDAAKELKEYTIISKIDKNQKYYLGVPNLCHVKKTKKTINAIEKCTNLKSHLKKSVKDSIGNLDMLVMKDGGINLKTLSKKIESMPITSENVIIVKKIWGEMINLFDGIIAFQKYDYAHHDLKPQNIVYNDETGVRFIDFGHMRNMTHEKNMSSKSKNWIYNDPFWNYPLEIAFLNKSSFTNFAKKTNDEKDAYFRNIIDNLNDNDNDNNDNKFVEAFRYFLDYVIYNRNNLEEENAIRNKYLLKYHEMLVEQIKPANYKLFLDKSIKTIDVYGLAMTLFYLLNCSRKFLKEKTIEQMEQCFFNMTTPNLFERYMIIESRTHFEKIMADI